MQNKVKHDDLFEQTLVLKSAEKVDIHKDTRAPHIEISTEVTTSELLGRDINSDALESILFTIPRKMTFLVIRALYKVSYGNVYYETFQFDEIINDDVKDLVCCYVPGKETMTRCVRIINSFGGKCFEFATDR